jgi:hypothetical protein
MYEEAIPATAGEYQRRETMRAFVAGMAVTMETLAVVGEALTEPSGCSFLDAFEEELKTMINEMSAGDEKRGVIH